MAVHHRIIEVGIVLLEGGEVIESWSSLVNPGVRILPSIEDFTGITNSMVEDAPPFEDLRREVRRRLDGRLFVAHNARFDYGFVRNEFRRLGEKFAAPVLCTVKLSRALFREHPRHNLGTLIERYGLECLQRHRALGDAAVLPAPLPADVEIDLPLGEALRRGFRIIDIRGAEEMEAAPLPVEPVLAYAGDRLVAEAASLLEPAASYLVVCARGGRSLAVVERLRAAGHGRVHSLARGASGQAPASRPLASPACSLHEADPAYCGIGSTPEDTPGRRG